MSEPQPLSQKKDGPSSGDVSPLRPGGQERALMLQTLDRQKRAFIADGQPSADLRKDRLNRAINLVVGHKDSIVKALAEDFGHRSVDQSLSTDVMSSIGPLKHARSHLSKWMKPERRGAEFPFNILGAKAELRYQPKGTVGIISPWNYPVQLTFAPLAGILAAGNRAMIKPSEFTPATSDLMAELFSSAFDETEIAVFTGGPEVGQAFSSLPFDHLLFTGATSIGRHIMRAAAENLVPVTLELGGKSPVILGKDSNFEKAAKSIVFGKMMNAGQTCLAPDYILTPRERLGDFTSAIETATQAQFPTLRDNPDYTAVINDRHLERLKDVLQEARDAGAEIIEVNPAKEDFSQSNVGKMPLYLVIDPSDELKVMQDELFGPILPIKSYDTLDDAVAYVNDHDRPLGLYYFGDDKEERETVLGNTISGGVTVNDVIMHIAQENLPFGGIGPSGMGHYHGVDGFKEFSHGRAVYHQTGIDLMKLLRPPYTKAYRDRILGRIKP